MSSGTISIYSHHGSKSAVERAGQAVFTACGFFAVLAVASIALYMVVSGTPALFKVGIREILFGNVWRPTASDASFGILYVILTSIVGTFMAILIGVPIGVLSAVFLAEVAPPRLAGTLRPAVELLAGIPSVIYGLLGILLLNPLMYKLELLIFKGSETHQFTGGANLISAVLVLALMILPTVCLLYTSYRYYVEESLRLGREAAGRVMAAGWAAAGESGGAAPGEFGGAKDIYDLYRERCV